MTLGILDRLKKKGKKEEKEAYYLQYQPAGQKGWVPVERFNFPISINEAQQYMLEAGVYNLQKRVGGMIAGYAWEKPYVVKGVASEEAEEEKGGKVTDSDRIAKAIEDDMVRAVRWFKLPEMIQKAIKNAFGGGENPIAEMAEGGAAVVTAKGIKEVLKGMKGDWQELDEIFGSKATTEDKKIPVKGDIPAWLVYMPDIIDQMGEKIEKRLERIGFIGEAKPSEKLLKMPEKPVATKKLDLGRIKREVVEKEEKEEKKGGGESKPEEQ